MREVILSLEKRLQHFLIKDDKGAEAVKAISDKLLISFYGDDFTGSTDSMEALMLGGVKTVLFLEPPSPELLKTRFQDIRAFGIAGISRSMRPSEMEAELRPIFEYLKAIDTTIVHYKICSTFDSSPDRGSIGQAAEIGMSVFGKEHPVPLLVGAPALKRYTMFGNHFATVRDETYRLDRHPTMSRHPVTPMDEADLRIHLSKQTGLTVALMDIHDLTGEEETVMERLRERLAVQPDILLYDVLDDERLERAGQLIWEEAGERGSRFVIGSSGVEYALCAHWRRQDAIEQNASPLFEFRGAVERLFVVSGSCSPVTEAQIRVALDYGFVGIPVNVEVLVAPEEAEAYRQQLLQHALAIWSEGRSPLLYTAMGSENLAKDTLKVRMREGAFQSLDTGRLIGEQLGKLTREFVGITGLRRFVAAGGDTSGYVTRELGIYGLECLTPIDPGGPLCLSHSEDPLFHGKELALKGGQVGSDDYFVRVLKGE